jgi:membrane-associated protease RseP (regulator of RpoE activity)
MSNPLIPPGEPIDVYVPYEDRPLLRDADFRSPPGRRVMLPVMLFVATCASTFFAGATEWMPSLVMQIPGGVEQAITQNWPQGLIYMAAVIGILLTHEMGHFLQAVRYHIPASLPFFIPLPVMMTGTMGAVIGMEGSRADRKQLFDIGISGPLAGLVIALPIVVWGILTGDPAPPRQMAPNGWHLNDPLIIKLLIHWLRPEIPFGGEMFLNPLLMAGWVGMLITGLNMMPVSQLDGGHVIYGLFGKRAHLVARLFVVGAIAAMLYYDSYNWIVMLALVLFIGIDHPPTRDDNMKLGPMRTIIGWLSLLIPFFCFTPVIM